MHLVSSLSRHLTQRWKTGWTCLIDIFIYAMPFPNSKSNHGGNEESWVGKSSMSAHHAARRDWREGNSCRISFATRKLSRYPHLTYLGVLEHSVKECEKGAGVWKWRMLLKLVLVLQKLSGEWSDFIKPICIDVFCSRNSTDTIIYNQCANIMLRYAIKLHEGHTPNTPKQLFDINVEVPPPPAPGDIKVVVAGLPWQVGSLHLHYKVKFTSLPASHTPRSTCSRKQTT